MAYKRKIVSFRVDRELFDRMTEAALAEDRTVGSWLRRIVDEELNKVKKGTDSSGKQ